jgi:hypothetical protein
VQSYDSLDFDEVMTNRIRNNLSRRRPAHLAVIVIHAMALALLCSAQSGLSPRSGSLPKDEPQAVYHPDPGDSWNRIFYCLFTRSVKTRLSQDFSEGAPFTTLRMMLGFSELRVSTSLFERIEGGDGAIDPLYPSFISSDGAAQALMEPRYSILRRALTDALGESRDRPALDRALMQGDVWAAFDILSQYRHIKGPQGESLDERRSELASLLARFIRKLALRPEEIKGLPDNYAAATGAHRLPDLFGARSKWMEIKWLPGGRMHDNSVHFRRAARVFIKATSQPADRQAFLDELRTEMAMRLDAVALVIQSMLIDSNGTVTPSPITFEVQQRSFIKDRRGNFLKTELGQFEISRRLFLSNPRLGGLVALDEKSGGYLPSAGNDYNFASNQFREITGVDTPVYAALRTRCVSCHEQEALKFITFTFHTPPGPPPPVEQLKPADNKHGNYVAHRKMERDDFKALLREWTVPR